MSKQTVTLEYQIDSTLRNALRVTEEIENETGLQPTSVIYEGKRLKYDDEDVTRYLCGEITEDEYIKLHLEL